MEMSYISRALPNQTDDTFQGNTEDYMMIFMYSQYHGNSWLADFNSLRPSDAYMRH